MRLVRAPERETHINLRYQRTHSLSLTKRRSIQNYYSHTTRQTISNRTFLFSSLRSPFGTFPRWPLPCDSDTRARVSLSGVCARCEIINIHTFYVFVVSPRTSRAVSSAARYHVPHHSGRSLYSPRDTTFAVPL